MKSSWFACLTVFFLTGSVSAAVKTETLAHTGAGRTFESFVAWDSSRKGPRPAVLLVHDWMGLGDYTKQKARELARQGYVALAADVYGKGAIPKNIDEAKVVSGRLRGGDREELRQNMRAAYDALRARKDVDARHIVVMGYCFGGTAALELARSGAELAGTVSFHGGLGASRPAGSESSHAPVLILHGADDPNVPPAEVNAVQEELRKAGVLYKLVSYPGAVHAFTNPKAGSDNSKGAAYHAEADRKSWVEFQNFLKEVAPSR